VATTEIQVQSVHAATADWQESIHWLINTGVVEHDFTVDALGVKISAGVRKTIAGDLTLDNGDILQVVSRSGGAGGH